jgi:putative spermidine/putrescine transport system ATP-binding protein
LTKLFGETRAVDGLSLEIEPGSICALLGPSGCGKTTTLRMIAGLLQPDTGEIFLDNRPITRAPVHKRNIGMLFQNYALFPHLTVAQNITFGLEMRHLPRATMAGRVVDALRLVQLADYGQRMPSRLSGGQQQRVALARALVVEPAVLLLDEPLGALDKSLRQEMQVELRQLQRRLGITTIMVTHDQDEALTMADRIAIMRDGRLEQFGSPAEVYQRPASTFVASFLGAANFFRGTIVGSEHGRVRVQGSGGLVLSFGSNRATGDNVTVALRPEALTVEPVGDDEPALVNTTRAVVEQVVYHGFVTHLHLRRPDGSPLIAFRQNGTRSDRSAITPGMTVNSRWAEESLHPIDDEPT